MDTNGEFPYFTSYIKRSTNTELEHIILRVRYFQLHFNLIYLKKLIENYCDLITDVDVLILVFTN